MLVKSIPKKDEQGAKKLITSKKMKNIMIVRMKKRFMSKRMNTMIIWMTKEQEIKKQKRGYQRKLKKSQNNFHMNKIRINLNEKRD